jgi:hypothetical protein
MVRPHPKRGRSTHSGSQAAGGKRIDSRQGSDLRGGWFANNPTQETRYAHCENRQGLSLSGGDGQEDFEITSSTRVVPQETFIASKSPSRTFDHLKHGSGYQLVVQAHALEFAARPAVTKVTPASPADGLAVLADGWGEEYVALVITQQLRNGVAVALLSQNEVDPVMPPEHHGAYYSIRAVVGLVCTTGHRNSPSLCVLKPAPAKHGRKRAA